VLKKSIYYINTNEIPGELSRENMISSHVKISPLLWLHNKSRVSQEKTVSVIWFGISLVSLRSLVKYFSTLEGKFRISKRLCNILYFLFFSVARLKSTKLGIKLVGGTGQNFIHGDPGIFVSRVRPGSLADGRLYKGDRIVAVCIIALSSYHANLLIQSTLALRTPRYNGHPDNTDSS